MRFFSFVVVYVEVRAYILRIMSKTQRRILFYFSAGVFLILSSTVIVYALGYKYDFLENRFVKTGSLHIKVQTNALIFINDKLNGQTSFLNNSFSKSGLLPREYRIRVEKEGYHSWQKTVSIDGGILSDFSSVFLVNKNLPVKTEDEPEIAVKVFADKILPVKIDELKKIAGGLSVTARNIKKAEKHDGYFYVLVLSNGRQVFYKIRENFKEPEFIAQDVKNFIFDNGGNKFSWFSGNELWVKWLKDAPLQPLKKTGEEELMARTSKNIRAISWHLDDQHLFALVGDEIEFIELDGRRERNSYEIFQAKNIENINYSSKKLFVLLSDKVVSLEL